MSWFKWCLIFLVIPISLRFSVLSLKWFSHNIYWPVFTPFITQSIRTQCQLTVNFSRVKSVTTAYCYSYLLGYKGFRWPQTLSMAVLLSLLRLTLVSSKDLYYLFLSQWSCLVWLVWSSNLVPHLLLYLIQLVFCCFENVYLEPSQFHVISLNIIITVHYNCKHVFNCRGATGHLNL